MKNKAIISYFSYIFLAIILCISLCKEDIYGNIRPLLTIGNYLLLFRIDNIVKILVSFLISLMSILVLIVVLYPLVRELISLKRRKQHMLLFFLLVPTCINNFFKQILLSSVTNMFINAFLNITLFLLPIVLIIMFYILKSVNLNQLEAAKDMGDNYFRSFIKIIWPLISMKVIYWLVFLTILGSNLIIFNNSYSLGTIIYDNADKHLHIPFICSLLCIECLLLLLVNIKRGKHE